MLIQEPLSVSSKQLILGSKIKYCLYLLQMNCLGRVVKKKKWYGIIHIKSLAQHLYQMIPGTKLTQNEAH